MVLGGGDTTFIRQQEKERELYDDRWKGERVNNREY